MDKAQGCKDLSGTERAIVHSKIKPWNFEKKQIMYGKMFEIRKLSAHTTSDAHTTIVYEL